VPLRVRLELPHPLNRFIDLTGRHLSLLRETMRDDGRKLFVEKVEDSVVDALKPDPKLINPVTQNIRLGPPKLMA
jgi:hypothetical protein